MTEPRPPQAQSDGLDRATLERMLSLGGSDLRPVLVAQLLADLSRLRAAIGTDDPLALARAAHEIKGLAATIGAHAVADQAARLDELATSATSQVRGVLSRALQQEVDRLAEVLGAGEGRNSPV